MPVPTPDDALRRLRRLYRDAHHLTSQLVDDKDVLKWATTGHLSVWATHKIRSGWSFLLVEGTVRSVRQLQRRAILAIPQASVAPESPTVETAKPFDPIPRMAERRLPG